MLEADGAANLIQKFFGVLFRHRPFPPRFDKEAKLAVYCRRRRICIVNQIAQLRLHIVQPKFGISQLSGMLYRIRSVQGPG